MRTADDKAALAREVLSPFVRRRSAIARTPSPRHCLSAFGPPAVILVPVKNLSSAKQRLAARSRSAVAHRAGAGHAVRRAHHARTAGTDRPAGCGRHQRSLRGEAGRPNIEFEVIPDPDNPGETGAIEMATRICVERGVESTLVIPADIPLIRSVGTRRNPEARSGGRQRARPRRRRTRHQRRLPPSRKSVSRCASATTASNRITLPPQATGKPCVVLNLPGIAVDVDNPEDLQQLHFAPRRNPRPALRPGMRPSRGGRLAAPAANRHDDKGR